MSLLRYFCPKLLPQHCVMHRLHNRKLQKRNVLSVKSLAEKVIENFVAIVYVHVSFQPLVI